MIRNSKSSWGLVSRVVHWAMAGLVLWMLYLGTKMAGTLNLFAKFSMVQEHKSFGFVVFVMLIARLSWRFCSPTPRLPENMPRWQVVASHASHALLYLLLIAVPVTGWLMVTSSPLNDEGALPFQVRNMVFGLFEMPDPFEPGSAELSRRFGQLHWLCTRLLMLLLAVHVLAALKHQFIDRDGLLVRMILGQKPGR